ncbi:hypothetical protein HY745_01695 [Candidatus Desantisbacteria bacterium]|nr:hypothetical protein [Candidatus Desantisbacteria bacterium]
MYRFKYLFGMNDTDINKTCILLPVLSKRILEYFKIEEFIKGKLYGAGNGKNFTLIHTGVGAGFVGDTVLYLKNTLCKNIILFGSCGLVQKKDCLDIGSIVIPVKCYSNESFTDMLLNNDNKNKFLLYPDEKLVDNLLIEGERIGITKAVCSTVSSLKLEEDRHNLIIKKEINILDMECSAFFSALNYTGLKGAALFYVSDIIKSLPFYNPNDSQKTVINSSIKKAAGFLFDFMQHLV